MFAELKVAVKTFASPVTPFLESVVWDDQRAAIDPDYGQPDQYAGIYEVQKIGNGGRELALKDVFWADFSSSSRSCKHYSGLIHGSFKFCLLPC